MIVRMVWPKCAQRRSTGEEIIGDAFWVECPLEEVGAILARVPHERRVALEKDIAANLAPVRARVASCDRERAEEMAEYGEYTPGPMEATWRRYGDGPNPWVCFLVSRDQSVIDAHPWSYPASNLWNGDSPFRAIPEATLGALSELSLLVVPASLDAT